MLGTAMTPVSIRLKELRDAKGWSQAELARRSGVPQSTISRIESEDTRSVNLDILEQLARALGVNAAVLIRDVEEPPPTPASPARASKGKRREGK